MAQPIIVEYAKDSATAIKATTAVIARLGYTLKSVDKENGLISFETGMSMKSWAGQSMSIHVLEVGGAVQLTMGGNRNAHGAQMQVYDWGEAAGIAKKIIEGLNQMLGQGKMVSGDLGGGGCFVATAIYGSYDNPSVLILRQFRDQKLSRTIWGRWFIGFYYRNGPAWARAIGERSYLKSPVRSLLDLFVGLLR